MDTRQAPQAAQGGVQGGSPREAAASRPTSEGAAPRSKRGRMLVGVAALVAGALAKASERVASAADGEPLLLGRTNNASGLTVLDSMTWRPGGLAVYSAGGVFSSGVTAGVIAYSSDRFGTAVVANSRGSFADGVVASGGFNGTGVWANGGIFGVVANSSRSNGTGVWANGGTLGVVASSSSSNGTGLSASGGTFGVVGISTDGIGVRGQADSGASAKGVVGKSRDGFAGYFEGRVYATDSVTTEATLSIAARHPDGSRRRLHSLASPMSHFQEFGKATLVRGRATVPLDPDFAALVQTDDYLVFLTPEGRTRGLFVSRKTPTAFEVRDGDEDDENAGVSTDTRERPGVQFAWQVVARRRDATGAATRLEPLTQPAPVPELPPMPEVPPLPDLPDLRQASP